jgi:predicted ATPase
MRIRSVAVEKLFGIFDHKINLRSTERITIIHGPNGFGKTVVLRMLAAVFRGRYSIFRHTPFHKFTVELDDATIVVERMANKQADIFDKRREVHEVKIRVTQGGHHEEIVLGRDSQKGSNRELGSYLAHRLELEQVGAATWRDPETRELLTYDDLIERAPDDLWQTLPHARKELLRSERSPLLNSICQSTPVSFIGTDRLESVAPTKSSTRSEPVKTAVRYSSEMASLLDSVLKDYGKRAQELDRTFPTRLFEFQDNQALPVSELRTKLTQLESKSQKLTGLGFLDPEQGFAGAPEYALERRQDVLSIYVTDVEQKLRVFDDPSNKVSLLLDIVNSRFLYKTMQVARETGFVFRGATGSPLSSHDLSSGEQHELVLLYELLFKISANSLVLIDEPEISLHAAWQEKFLHDLRRIVQLSGFDVLLATHSPEIIGDNWALTEELKGPVAPIRPVS